jgi:hypothetical protein
MRESTELECRSRLIKTGAEGGDLLARRSLSFKQTIFNAAVFQGAWFDLLVFHSGIAIFFITALGIQLICVYKVNFLHLLVPLLSIFSLGLLLDALLSFYGLYSFDDSSLLVSVIPLWLVMLWLAFTLTLPVSFLWLLHKPSLAVIVFASLAPLSYIAGRHLGAIVFSNTTIILISLAWATVAYLSCRLLGPVIIKAEDMIETTGDVS